MWALMLWLILVCRTNAHNANVEIQKHGDERTYTCGKNLTITCKLKEHRLAMAWMDGNSIISIAECVERSCNLNPAFNGQYTFSYNIEEGIYNLTVIKVTKKDNGKRLVCSDGSHTDFLVLKVNGHDAQLIEDKQNGSIIAKSGCISDEKKVTFKWISVSPDNGLEQEIQREVQCSNDSCVNDSICGFNQHTRYRATLFAKQTGNGKYIKFAMEFGSERIESRKSDALYLIEEQDYGPYSNTEIGGFVGSVIMVVVVVVAVAGALHKIRMASICRKKKEQLQNEGENIRRKLLDSETLDNSNQQNKVNNSERQERRGKNDCSNRLEQEPREIEKNEASINIETSVNDSHNFKESRQGSDENRSKPNSLQGVCRLQVEHRTQCQVASQTAETVVERMKNFASSTFEMLE